MLNNITNYSNLISNGKIRTLLDATDLFTIGVRDPNFIGNYQPALITATNLANSIIPLLPFPFTLTTTGTSGASTLIGTVLNIPNYTSTGVASVTGLDTDNTDPLNPIVNIAVDGVTVTGDGTSGNPLVSVAGGVASVTGLDTDNTDPLNPIVQISVDGTTITGDGTSGNPLVAASTAGTINESKVIYVDSVYGNDATGLKYDLTKPFLTYSAAAAVAIAGDWIVFNAGSHTIFTVTPVSNVNVYCKPGAIINGGFNINSSITWKLLGFAVFSGSLDALRVVGTGQTYDIQFEFDKIDGLMSFGIVVLDTSSPSCKLQVNCTSITASVPFRLNGGSVYDVVVNCKYKISGYNSSSSMLMGGGAGVIIMLGTIIINSPIIENTSISSTRCVINFTNNSRNVIINAETIRMTSSTFVDSGINNLGTVVFSSGDNNFVNGNIEAGPVPCIISNTSGATPIYGNITFTGNLYSDREIVQHYQKVANGNGWMNIIIKNGFIQSKGIGLSNSMFNRANNWNFIHGGIPGSIQVLNCVVYNQNFNASATAAVMRDDVSGPAKINNFQIYNSLAYIEGGVGFLEDTTQPAKQTFIHNVRSNINIAAVVTDVAAPTGLIVDPNLIIPKPKL